MPTLKISHRQPSTKPKSKSRKKKKNRKEFIKNKNEEQKKFKSNFKNQAIDRKEPKLNLEIDQQLLNCTSNRLKEWQAVKPVSNSDTKFSLDPWQQEVLNYLKSGKSVVVDAPTSAGKTRAVEFFFAENINNKNFRAAYTTPIKSLSNDKLREFREKFGEDKIGIATGDIKENLNAPIVIATLECYRNSLLGVDPDLGRNLVVFDEYHYIQDESRGSAWEEAIILSPKNCQLLLLSASVNNSQNFANWISNLRDEQCMHVQTTHRPVPLKDMVNVKGQWIAADCLPQKFKINQQTKDKKKRKAPEAHDPIKIAKGLVSTLQLKLAPTIVYCGRRMHCELMAKYIKDALNELSILEQQEILQILNELNTKYQSLDLMPSHLKHSVIKYGVAYHHSGLAPACRLAIEVLLKQAKLRFCTATMGLSLGINFGVRSAIISDYQRPGNAGLSTYTQSEVLQMLGRAGRRGRDEVGFSLWPSLEAYHYQGGAVREDCFSTLRIDPITFLGLTSRGFDHDEIENFYRKSFMNYHSQAKGRRLISEPLLRDILKAKLPCISPAFEFANYLNEEKSKCNKCHLKRRCHSQIQKNCHDNLSFLQVHLHRLGTIDEYNKLSEYGEVAKHFPQNGGLLIAKMLHEGKITSSNLLAATQLAASFCVPRFKEIAVSSIYRFPFDIKTIQNTYESFYPYEIFPELYDEPWGPRRFPVVRDFNPNAGYIVGEWLRGRTWEDLSKEVCTDYYGNGDMMGLMFRIGTYLHSIASASHGELKNAALSLRSELLRSPLYITI